MHEKGLETGPHHTLHRPLAPTHKCAKKTPSGEGIDLLDEAYVCKSYPFGAIFGIPHSDTNCHGNRKDALVFPFLSGELQRSVPVHDNSWSLESLRRNADLRQGDKCRLPAVSTVSFQAAL